MQGIAAHGPAMRVRPRVPYPGTTSGRFCVLFLPSFRHCFAAVAGMAQGLQVVPVREQIQIPLVGLDVVHVCGSGADAVTGALPAIRLPQELAGAKIVGSFRRQVQPVPGGAIGAALGLGAGLVNRAVAIRHQDVASRMSARPQGFLAQGYHLLAKQKRRSPWLPSQGISHGLRRSTLWPLSICRMISDLQSRQNTGRRSARVSGYTCSSRRLRRQTGHTTHPSATISLPLASFFCKAFPSLSC